MGKEKVKKPGSRPKGSGNTRKAAPAAEEPIAVSVGESSAQGSELGGEEMEDGMSGIEEGRDEDTEGNRYVALAISKLPHPTPSSFLYSGSESGPSTAMPRTRAPRKTLAQKVYGLLPVFKETKLSPFDVILAILDEDNYQFKDYRKELYKASSSKLEKILSLVSATENGREKLSEWIRGEAGTSCIGDAIAQEMDAVRDTYTLSGLADVSPQYIRNHEDDVFVNEAPFTMKILRYATQTKRQEAQNVKKTPDDVSTLRLAPLELPEPLDY